MSTDKYAKLTSQIHNLAVMPPEQLANHLEKTNRPLMDVAPNIVPHLVGTASRAVDYLHQNMPKPLSEFVGAHAFEPSPGQKGRWLEQHDIVNDPISALEHVKNGTLTQAHMNALQAVHPDRLSNMQQKVMENATPANMKNLHYSTKIALSKFLGRQLDESLMPRVILGDQMNYAQAPQMAPPMGKKEQSTQSGLNKLDVNKMAETETNKTEED